MFNFCCVFNLESESSVNEVNAQIQSTFDDFEAQIKEEVNILRYIIHYKIAGLHILAYT